MFGKAGRADTATDPAPLEMFETTIQFKPREQWRAGMTPDKLVEELDRAVKVPGLTNVWVPPIRNRIDMLATGIKSPVGIKVAGTDLATIDRLTTRIEAAVQERARRVVGPGGAADRRPLHRCRRRPGGGGAPRPVGRRRPGGRRDRHRRRQRRRGRPGPRALSHQRPLSARDPRLAGAPASAALRHRQGRAAAAAGRRARSPSPRGRRCCAAKMRACRGGSTSTCAVATSARWSTTCRPRWPRQCRCLPAMRCRGPASSSTWSAPRSD